MLGIMRGALFLEFDFSLLWHGKYVFLCMFVQKNYDV